MGGSAGQPSAGQGGAVAAGAGGRVGGAAGSGGEATAGGGGGGASAQGGTGGSASEGGSGEAGRGEGGAGGEPGGHEDLECGEDNGFVETIGRTTDGEVEFELERCMAELCGGGCQVYRVYLRLTYQGRTDEAVDDVIEYNQTHHNWGDSLVATLPDRVLLWHTSISTEEFEQLHFVAVETLDGTPILPELLVPAETRFIFQ